MNAQAIKDPESYFNLWRAIVSITHVDNIVTIEERQQIESFLSSARLSSKQLDILRSDLENQISPEKFIDLITVPSHLAQLHHLANIVFHTDKMDYREDVFLKELEATISKRINFLGALKMVEEEKRLYEEEESQKEVKGFFNTLVEFYRD